MTIEALLHDVFRAQGAVDALGLAQRAAKDFALAQRDSRIYEMRDDMTVADISHVTGLSHRRIEQIYREQMFLRRSALQNT